LGTDVCTDVWEGLRCKCLPASSWACLVPDSLMGALSRVVNDDYKKSTDLAVTVIQIFHWWVRCVGVAPAPPTQHGGARYLETRLPLPRSLLTPALLLLVQ
jgi:hypothetical protein